MLEARRKCLSTEWHHYMGGLEGQKIAGVPGEKPEVTSDKLSDSPSKFPSIQL